jgi:prevent-host-death family protein
MVKKVSTVQLRKELSALLAQVVESNGQVIIEKRGKPLAALVSVDALELIKQQQTTSANPQGALALAGAWGELKDREMDALLADIRAERGGDACRTEGKA